MTRIKFAYVSDLSFSVKNIKTPLKNGRKNSAQSVCVCGGGTKIYAYLSIFFYIKFSLMELKSTIGS